MTLSSAIWPRSRAGQQNPKCGRFLGPLRRVALEPKSGRVLRRGDLQIPSTSSRFFASQPKKGERAKFVCLFVGCITDSGGRRSVALLRMAPTLPGGISRLPSTPRRHTVEVCSSQGPQTDARIPINALIRVGRRGPFCAPDTDPSLGVGARGRFALQGPCPY